MSRDDLPTAVHKKQCSADTLTASVDARHVLACKSLAWIYTRVIANCGRRCSHAFPVTTWSAKRCASSFLTVWTTKISAYLVTSSKYLNETDIHLTTDADTSH